mgnify:CR=1 FL=1
MGAQRVARWHVRKPLRERDGALGVSLQPQEFDNTTGEVSDRPSSNLNSVFRMFAWIVLQSKHACLAETGYEWYMIEHLFIGLTPGECLRTSRQLDETLTSSCAAACQRNLFISLAENGCL